MISDIIHVSQNSIRDAINRSNIFIRVSLGGSPQLSEDEQDLRLTAWSLRDDPKTRYLSRVGAVSKESRATGRTKFRNILPAMAKAENVITTLSHEEEGQTYKENKALSMYHVMLLNAGIQEKKNVIVAKARSARAKMVQSQITDADTKSQQSASMCDDIATGTAAIVHSCDRHLSERSTVAPDEKGPESPDTTTARKHYSGRSEQQPFFNFKYLPLPFPSCDEHDDFHYDNDGSSDHTSAAAYVDIGWKEHDDMFQDLDDVDSSLGTQQILPAHREEDLVVKMTPLLYLRPSLTGDYASALQESQDVVIA